MNFEIKNGCLREYLGNTPVVVIPDGVTEISTYAFKSRDDILEITLPESVMEVWSYAFAECEGLKKVNILGTPSLGQGAFYRCENLKELNAPRGLKDFKQGAFAGCPNLESTDLSDKTFKLYTLNGNRSLDEMTYLRDTDISREAYSWDEYKRIMSDMLDYVLIYSEDYCSELEGPVIPEIEEKNHPIVDDIIVVKDGRFVGCALEEENTFYVNNRIEIQKKLVLVKPSDKPVMIRAMVANHLPFHAHSYVNAFFRRCDDPNGWIGKVNSIHKLV